MNFAQIGLMVADMIFVTVLFLACFRLRGFLGLVPVYTMLGVVFYVCGFLAAGVYVEVAPGIVVSPGSVAFFPAIPFVVLCVYITEDAAEARRLMYSLFVANVFLVGLGWLTAQTLRLPGALNPYHLSPDLFAASPRVETISLLALVADTFLIILLYEFISRFTRLLVLRIYASMAITLAFDTVLFVTGSFVEKPEYLHILVASLVGKVLAAIVYSLLVTVYLDRFDSAETAVSTAARGVGTVFKVLTYRQRYELLAERSVRDGLTGVYNRSFFDEVLPAQIAMARRTKNSLTFLMVDLDHFKRVNDECGHQEGDRVLREVAAALHSTFRSSDFVCRYGGEEFGVILPNTDARNAVALGEKARTQIAQVMCLPAGRELPQAITATIGVAVFPLEAATPEELVHLADARLYEGKSSGRNRIVAGSKALQA